MEKNAGPVQYLNTNGYGQIIFVNVFACRLNMLPLGLTRLHDTLAVPHAWKRKNCKR